MIHVADRLYTKMDEKRTPLCVGLDPNLELFPKPLLELAARQYGSSYRAAAEAIKWFNFAIIDATFDLVQVYKPQSAYYEEYGSEGIRALEDTVKHAQAKGAVVILDAKRNDIGETSKAYAEGHLGKVLLPDGSYARSPDDVDLMTVNGYLGSDGIKPFAEVANRDGKGIFVLAKTSNSSSGELQDILTKDGPEVFAVMAGLIGRWGSGSIGQTGYSNVGAVVGATFPEQARIIRAALPYVLFLMPGYGAQGAKAEILVNGFDENGRGAVVNSSRGITYAFSDAKEFAKNHPELAKPEKFAEAARQATIDAIADLNKALRGAGKLPKQWVTA